jgi:hypothetical protein
MNILELNATADALLGLIKSSTDSPRDGIAILGLALCKLYDDACGDPEALPFATFAGDFHMSLLATHRDVSSSGPVTRQ